MKRTTPMGTRERSMDVFGMRVTVRVSDAQNGQVVFNTDRVMFCGFLLLKK